MFARLKITIEETPNPDARKFTANRRFTRGDRRTFYSPREAAAHPLAAALFAVEGVTGVMLLNDFCTVNKTSDARWTTLSPQVKRLLLSALRRRTA